ncbi:SulP family inorganic anion transporter [Saccharibacillus sp. CPCC 101409]|uniref:SulP family inorganic anion transporter n=1 Tax=Saccharibacillus sp. CPCC 101409 TaxID=3058041 RepID=UPI0026735DF8|nr:SulP family inorganic anion transporter [Saccharibacillus sp. CPCC 101409]MDO3410150.1 SulP family inorganic anion transporter [Saccharibacillus sp. CPCC 101409]
MELRKQWFGNVRGDVLSGVTVALALIPEAIGFSIVAGVDPIVGLHASIVIAIVIAFVGGRAGMISAATGAMAVLMGGLYRDHGMEYLLAAGVLAGIIQVGLGALGIGRFITFIPKPVMTGFVNALAIIIFMAQLPQFVGAGPAMYAIVAGTLAIIYILPRFTRAVPAPLVAIIVMSLVAVWLGLDIKTVGEMGELSSTPPLFHIPQIDLTWSMLGTILPVSVSLALVGLLESLLTATIMDDMTETKSNKNAEARGQGIANIVNGFFGGMAGCAMIGQSVINIKSGGRGRLSTFTAGAFLLIILLLLGGIVSQIPLAALVGVMVMVSIGTFDWSSLYRMNKIPLADTIVMLVVVGIVVATDNLSIGVGAGVVLSTLHFGWKIAKLNVEEETGGGVKVYKVRGQMFFGTASHFVDYFSPAGDPDRIAIDFSQSHVWDHSAASAVARVKLEYYKHGKQVDIRGLNDESRVTIEKSGLSAPSGH